LSFKHYIEVIGLKKYGVVNIGKVSNVNIETEDSENKQCKIAIDEQIACIFAIILDDELI
jgi:hypothetical protein